MINNTRKECSFRKNVQKRILDNQLGEFVDKQAHREKFKNMFTTITIPSL